MAKKTRKPALIEDAALDAESGGGAQSPSPSPPPPPPSSWPRKVEIGALKAGSSE